MKLNWSATQTVKRVSVLQAISMMSIIIMALTSIGPGILIPPSYAADAGKIAAGAAIVSGACSLGIGIGTAVGVITAPVWVGSVSIIGGGAALVSGIFWLVDTV